MRQCARPPASTFASAPCHRDWHDRLATRCVEHVIEPRQRTSTPEAARVCRASECDVSSKCDRRVVGREHERDAACSLPRASSACHAQHAVTRALGASRRVIGAARRRWLRAASLCYRAADQTHRRRRRSSARRWKCEREQPEHVAEQSLVGVARQHHAVGRGDVEGLIPVASGIQVPSNRLQK